MAKRHPIVLVVGVVMQCDRRVRVRVCVHAHVQLRILTHFGTGRASLFTDHEKSGLPIRAKKKRFRTIWKQTLSNSPTDPISSSLNWKSSMHGVATLCNFCVVSFASSHFFHALLCMTFHVIGP